MAHGRSYTDGGWLTLHLATAAVDWAEVGEVETSYRQVALRRNAGRT